jgi:hypothetical protein
VPVLARLEQVEGITRARAEATGRFFALDLAPEADEARTLAAAERALRGAPRRLPPDEARAQLARAARGDRWFTRAEVSELCFLESRMIAARAEGAVGAAAKLDPAERGALGDALRDELFEIMERVLAEGGRDSSGWFYLEWPGLAARAAARCAGSVAAEKRERVRAALVALHAR